MSRWRISSFVVVVATLGACSSSDRPRGPAEQQPDPGRETEAVRAAKAAKKPKWSLPQGPMLAVQAGVGVGAIRLGANVGTIERLMGKPCEIETAELCRYVSRGIDFHLVNAHLDWIHVQRAGRPAGRGFHGEQLEFGFFNGAIPPDLRLGMLPAAVMQYLGQPQRVERAPERNPTSLVERHYYPGLVTEYDRYSNGKLILGGVRVVKM